MGGVNTEDAPAVPDNMKVLKNGAWYDMDAKRIAKAPPPENRPIRDSESAREIANVRHEANRLAIAERVDAIAHEYGGEQLSGVSAVAARIAEAVMDDAANPKQRADAAHRLLRWADYVPSDRPGAREASDVPHISGRVDHVAAVLAPVMAELARRQAGGAVRDDGNEE